MLRVVFLATLFGVVVSAPGKLPASFKKCQKKDPKFNECLKLAAVDAVQKMAKGTPSLGVPPLEPLFLKELNIGNGKGQTVSIDLKLRDVDLIGFSSIEVTDIKPDVDNYRFYFKGKLNQPLSLKGQYQADGKVLILPIKGHGRTDLKLENPTATLEIIGKERKKDGVAYMDVKDVKFHFETSRLHLYFENLIGGDKAISENLNTVINESWKEILVDLKPGIEEALALTFKEIATRIFSKVPYNDIFL